MSYPSRNLDTLPSVQVSKTSRFQSPLNKRSRPQCPVDVIPRQRLLDLLDLPAQLTLVIAPAGYGKTTLVCNWLEAHSRPVAWVTLEESDGEVRLFLTHLVVAAQNVIPDFGRDLIEQLEGDRLPPVTVVAEMLFQALIEIEQQLVVILDDYHLLGGSEVHALISELLRLRPHRLHLVITARHDPPLPLVDLRLHAGIVELRGSDLRFSESETLRLFEGALPGSLDEREIGELVRGTEGWVMSLRLAKLYLRQEQGFASLSRALEAGAQHAGDYLAEEVFSRLPQWIRTFLERTAILERLCASACCAVTDGEMTEADAQLALLWLSQNGIFTVVLDDASEWFQYHALFRRLVTQQMRRHYTATQIDRFNRLASRWHAERGYIEGAIRHALAAGDRLEALQIFAEARTAMMNAEEWVALARLVRIFPRDFIDQQPELLLADLWIARSQNDTKTVRANIARTNAILNARLEKLTDLDSDAQAIARRWISELEALNSFACFWNCDTACTIRHGLQCLALTTPTQLYIRDFAATFTAMAYQVSGDLSSAYALLEERRRESWTSGPLAQKHILLRMAFVQSLAGELMALRTTTDQMIEIDKELPWTELSAAAYYLRALVGYVQNDLVAVLSIAPGLLARRYQVSPRYYMQCAYILVLTYHALGRPEAAKEVVDNAVSYVKDVNAPEYLPLADGLQAVLALREGNLEEADLLLRKHVPVTLTPMVFMYDVHMLLLRLYLRLNTVESLQSLSRLLSRLEPFLEATHSVRFLIETLALKALYLQRCGQAQAALDAMERSIRLAEPGGYIRVHADLGKEILGLLEQIQSRGVAPLLTTAIHAAIVSENTVQAKTITPIQNDLAVILTFREQEVLRLMGERLTNQEIAQILTISPQTVKRHSLNIFRKLNVTNRRAASLYARELSQ